MRQRVTQSWRTCHRGSMALAVVSCALALLAASPVVAEAVGRDEPAAVRTVGERPSGLATPVVRTGRAASVTVPALAGAARREESGAQQNSQVWVALERLGAFFVGELAPLLGVGGPEFVPAYERVSVEGAVEVRGGERVRASAGDLPETVEREFAQERCLLAPPA